MHALQIVHSHALGECALAPKLRVFCLVAVCDKGAPTRCLQSVKHKHGKPSCHRPDGCVCRMAPIKQLGSCLQLFLLAVTVRECVAQTPPPITGRSITILSKCDALSTLSSAALLSTWQLLVSIIRLSAAWVVWRKWAHTPIHCTVQHGHGRWCISLCACQAGRSDKVGGELTI